MPGPPGNGPRLDRRARIQFGAGTFWRKINLEPWQTNLESWKTMETNQKPWKTMKLPWKTMETNTKTMKNPETMWRDPQGRNKQKRYKFRH